MRIDFIGHATLLVQSGNLSLLTDPWWEGPAYQEQWFPYPFPVPERYDLNKVDALYLSHGHEDHMHEATLQTLKKDLALILPKSYDSGNREYMRELGFQQIQELPSGRSATLTKGGSQMRLTLFTYLGDSMLAIEADGQTMLNVNDALHCARPEVIREYCKILRKRFPKIDYLFCGFGGASYFPNCFRVDGKDDLAIAKKRELFFLQNFTLIAQLLEPRLAFPFAAHFILPDERNWWISELRFKMRRPAEIFADLSPATPVRCYDLTPGDYVEDLNVSCSAQTPVNDTEAIRREVLERYPITPTPAEISDEQFEALVHKISENSIKFAHRISNNINFIAVIKLWDFSPAAILVQFTGGRSTVARINQSDLHLYQPALVMETHSTILHGAVNWKYGRDLICIGYGVLLSINSKESIQANLHERLLDLITPFPNWRERFEKHPLQCLVYLLRDPGARFAFKKKFLPKLIPDLSPDGYRKQELSNSLYSINEWL